MKTGDSYPTTKFLSLVFAAFLTEAGWAAPLRLDSKADFNHITGKAVSSGWALDYTHDRPGYALSNLQEPLLLEPGFYRANFILRRGHYPHKGLLNNTNGIARLELWDTTTKELIDQRDLQRADFSSPTHFETRWIDFSMENRAGHRIEPRIYWMGLANAEIDAVTIERFSDVSPKSLAEKAHRLGDLQEKSFLENGFVVSRRLDGTPDELGDAVTYTSLYTASLAWKYGATHNELTLQALENALRHLHSAIKGSPDEPILTRFVDETGTPLYASPSKDVYTTFFLAYSVAYPLIKNEALKKQMRLDLENITNSFLEQNLTVQGGSGALISLTPYFTEEEVRKGIHVLVNDKKTKKNVLKGLKQARRMSLFAELWPGIKETSKAIEKGDEEKIYQMDVPTLNGIASVAGRTRDVLREQYRTDLFPFRPRDKDYPGKQLEALLTSVIKKFPPEKNGRRFERLSDLPVLSSNALIALHLVRTAAVITDKPQFIEYYRTNLYTQDALLKCALDWFGLDDQILRLTAGNAVADRERRGYLSALALLNLYQLETNPEVKASYKKLFDVYWKGMKKEDNPMSVALRAFVSTEKDDVVAPILHALDLYPEDRNGFAENYWEKNAVQIAETSGGGMINEYSREPLPVSMRPKDSFLWQRNPRRLAGDHARTYPATDYLFVYWFCRYNHIIPAAAPEPTVKK